MSQESIDQIASGLNEILEMAKLETEIAKLKKENEQLIEGLVELRRVSLADTGMKWTQADIHARTFINEHVNRIRSDIDAQFVTYTELKNKYLEDDVDS